MMQEFYIKDLNSIDEVAKSFIELYNTPAVFCFYGQMGAGKTTFIKAICDQLKSIDVVNSPTFAIVNEYGTENNSSIYHFDFYRVNNPQEALDMGYEDYFYSDSYCFVEWPEKIEDLLPLKRYDVSIELQDDDSRKVTVKEIS